jgi:hypothetical protein
VSNNFRFSPWCCIEAAHEAHQIFIRAAPMQLFRDPFSIEEPAA